MKALLLKDILVQKRMVVFSGFYSLIFFILFSFLKKGAVSGLVYAFVPIAVAFILIMGALKGEGQNTDVFVYSLPFTRDDIVRAKYLSLLLFAGLGIVSTAFFGAVFRLLPLEGQYFLIRPVDMLRVLAGVMIISGVFPVYFRFGIKAVRIVLVTLVVLGVGLQVAGMVTLIISQQKGSAFIIGTMIDRIVAVPLQRRLTFFLSAGALVCGVSYILSIIINRRKNL